MRIELRQYSVTQWHNDDYPLPLIAKCECELTPWGYAFATNPTTHFDEFEQALYAVNNDTYRGVIAENWIDQTTPVSPYMTFNANYEY